MTTATSNELGILRSRQQSLFSAKFVIKGARKRVNFYKTQRGNSLITRGEGVRILAKQTLTRGGQLSKTMMTMPSMYAACITHQGTLLELVDIQYNIIHCFITMLPQQLHHQRELKCIDRSASSRKCQNLLQL